MLNRGISYIHSIDKNLWVLCLGWFVSATGFAASIPFIAIYFNKTYQMSITEIGIFFGLMAIVRSAFQLVGGEVADRMQRRQLVVLAQAGRSVAFLSIAIGITNDLGLWWIAGSLLINSIFGAIFQPTANAMVADILPEEKRLDGYALTRSAGNLGWAAGPAIGGFMAGASYAMLFYISAAMTLSSCMILFFFLKTPANVSNKDRFHFRDLIAIKDDHRMAWHSLLILLLYLVVAQMIAPFSLFAVQMVGISEHELGLLYTLNGLLVVGLQLPVTRMLKRFKLTTQLAMGGILYMIGYTTIGALPSFGFFAISFIVVTMGEIFMSPPALTLTSRLAPEGKMGRYMGIFGFSVAAGWSFGPLYGGLFLDSFSSDPIIAWGLISSGALVSAIGYLILKRMLPDSVNSLQ